jgi:hypothetical protein
MARPGVRVELVIHTDKFTRKVNLLARSMKSLGKQLEQSGKRMQRLHIAFNRRPALIHNGRKP